MNKILLLILGVYLAVSCSSNQRKPLRSSDKKPNTALTPKKPKTNIPTDNSLKDFDKGNITKTKIFEDGVTVKWFFESFKKNPTLTEGEVCLINYRISLPDGKIFDGNNRLDLPFIPFMVGYNMQFKGWDLALKHLKVGDFAKIEIPSELAYGTKGFSNIVPANSPIWLYVKVVAKVSPEYNQGGIKTWTFDKGTPGKLDNSADKEV